MNRTRNDLVKFLNDNGLAEEVGGYGHATGEDVADMLIKHGWVELAPDELSSVLDEARSKLLDTRRPWVIKAERMDLYGQPGFSGGVETTTSSLYEALGFIGEIMDQDVILTILPALTESETASQ